MGFVYGFIVVIAMALYSDSRDLSGAIGMWLLLSLIAALIRKVYLRLRYGKIKTYRY